MICAAGQPGGAGAATVLHVTDGALGCDSEVGRLRAVILHRPGAELQRLTPRNNDALLFDGLPWVAKAQREHDAFAELLRSRGVEVLLLADLLRQALSHSGAARMHGVAAAVDPRRLGLPLAHELSAYLRTLDAAQADAPIIYSGTRLDWYSLNDGCCPLQRFGALPPRYAALALVVEALLA